MPKIEWNISFMIGVKEIDDHHKHLVELLNNTYSEFKGGVSVRPAVVGELLDYIAYHFACEERLMAETSFPELPAHKNEHEIFSERVLEFHKKCRLNENITLELLTFLSNWITHHILATDAKFGRYLDMESIRKRMAGQTQQAARVKERPSPP